MYTLHSRRRIFPFSLCSVGWGHQSGANRAAWPKSWLGWTHTINSSWAWTMCFAKDEETISLKANCSILHGFCIAGRIKFWGHWRSFGVWVQMIWNAKQPQKLSRIMFSSQMTCGCKFCLTWVLAGRHQAQCWDWLRIPGVDPPTVPVDSYL